MSFNNPQEKQDILEEARVHRLKTRKNYLKGKVPGLEGEDPLFVDNWIY